MNATTENKRIANAQLISDSFVFGRCVHE
jgi:hypothetical protein